MRLYFFPALLPLAPLLPLLLTALGAVAGLFRALRRARFAGWLAAALLCAAAGLFAYQKSRRPSDAEGSRLMPAASLPQARHFESAAAVSNPHPKKEGLLTEAWFHLGTHQALSATLASPEWIVIGTYEGEVQALSTRSGELSWSLPKTGPVLSQAAILGGMIFMGEGLHTAITSSLTAIELGSGKVVWERQFLGHLEAAPAVDKITQKLYVVTGPSSLWAIDARDGSVLWHSKLGHIDSTPLLHEGSLWVTSQPDEAKFETRLHELDPSTGESRFSAALPGQPWGAPLAAGDSLYFTTGIGQVGPIQPQDRGWSHAFSAKTRKLLWTTSLETMPLPESALSMRVGLVFHTLKTGLLVAQDLRDGHRMWTLDLHAPFLASPTLLENRGLLLVLPTDGKLALVDARSGKLLQRIEATPNASAAPLFDDKRIYTLGGDSHAAFELAQP